MDEQNNSGTDRSYDRMNSNAGNIGFAASMDAGNGFTVNAQCEQFTFYNQFADSTASTICNRNSKIGLAHADMGEIMFATWLLPYNEGVAQWVDPFYDAGADSHTNIMGSMGASSSTFYNPVFARTSGFNRRQDNIIQYWSPNWNSFVFRFAWTLGYRDETAAPVGDGEIDPIIRLSSLAYTNGPFWGAVTWQDHEDWSAAAHGEMESSDAESIRLAARYIHDMGDGVSIQISAMWEDVEHEFNGVTSVDAAMKAFGYSNWASSGNLMISDPALRAQKTLGVFKDLFLMEDPDNAGQYIYKTGSIYHTGYDPDGDGTANPVAVTAPTDLSDSSATILTSITPPSAAAEDNPLTAADDTKAEGETEAGNLGTNVDGTDDAAKLLKAHVMALQTAAGADGAHADTKAQYDLLVNTATANARAAQGGNVKIERDAWMVSGKIKFGGPLDFRFSYADADDLEVSCTGCSGDWDESGGDAWNRWTVLHHAGWYRTAYDLFRSQ